MKLVILLALVALVAAVPVQRSPVVVSKFPTVPSSPFLYQGQYTPVQSGVQGNIYHVAQYIAYQFHYAQQLGYTSTQLVQYLLQHGYPQVVAQWLGQQYETGLSQPYFKSPYLIFQYFQQQEVPQEVLQYIIPHITQGYQSFQDYLPQYGQQAYQQEFPGVPLPISQYVIQQGRYMQQGLTHSTVYYTYQQLLLAQQYVQNALQYFVKGQVPQQTYTYLYQQLQQGLEYIQNIEVLYQRYQSEQQQYVPYYAAQYYVQQIQQVYQSFLNAWQYIQQQGQGVLPQYFVQQVQQAYLTVEKVYQIYQKQVYPSYVSSSMGYSQGYYQAIYLYEQILQYIQTIQNYIQSQGTFPQSSYISQQLTLAYQAYQTIGQLWQQRYLPQPITSYVQQQFLVAYQYLQVAYKVAQQEGQQYIVQELQNLLQTVQYLQHIGQSFAGTGYYYGQGYQYGQSYQYPLRQVYQYTQNILKYIQEQVAQGVVSQVSVNYIIEQLELVEKYTGYPSVFISQTSYGYQPVMQQVWQYYQSIFLYIQENKSIPQPVLQYLTQQVQYVLNILQPYVPSYYTGGQSYLWPFIQKYMTKNVEYPEYNYQYGSYNQGYGYYGPYSSSYQYGRYVPYSTYGLYSPSSTQYWPSNSYGSHYGPYSQGYGTYQPSSMLGYTPTWSSLPTSTYMGSSQSYGYPYLYGYGGYPYGYSGIQTQIAAAAA